MVARKTRNVPQVGKGRPDSQGFIEINSKSLKKRLQSKPKVWEEKPAMTHGGLYLRDSHKVKCHRDYSTKFVEKMRIDLDREKRSKMMRAQSAKKASRSKIKVDNKKEKVPVNSSESDMWEFTDIIAEHLAIVTKDVNEYLHKHFVGEFDQHIQLQKMCALNELQRRTKAVSKLMDKAFNQVFNQFYHRSRMEEARQTTKVNVREHCSHPRAHNFTPNVMPARACKMRKKNDNWADNISRRIESSMPDHFNRFHVIEARDNRKKRRPRYEMARASLEAHDAEFEHTFNNDVPQVTNTGWQYDDEDIEAEGHDLIEATTTDQQPVASVTISQKNSADSSSRLEDTSDNSKKIGKEVFSSSISNIGDTATPPAGSKVGKGAPKCGSYLELTHSIPWGSSDHDYVTLRYDGTALNADKKLPPYSDLSDIKTHLVRFMTPMNEFARIAKYPRDSEKFAAVHPLYNFLGRLVHELNKRYPRHHAYFENFLDDLDRLYVMMKKVHWQARENDTLKEHHQATKEMLSSLAADYDSLSTTALNDKLIHELAEKTSLLESYSTVKISSPPPTVSKLSKSVAMAPGGDDDGGGDDSDSKKKGSGKKKSKKKKGKKKKESSSDSDSYDDSSDSSVDLDKDYRKILRSLTKSAKDYKIKDLTMNSDPALRRERFTNWVIDLRNILSTHHKSAGLLDDYPAELNHFDDNVDRAIKALLSSITSGMAKRIVGKANTAYDALIDLKRNYGQTSKFDVHREEKLMMNMRQNYGESASEFLRRIRKQMDSCDAVGCTLYSGSEGEEIVTNIVLDGLNGNIRAYSATIAELKAQYRRNPSSVLLTELEEIFFNIDDGLKSLLTTKKERANFIVGQIICHFCKQPGHMKRECPKLKNKNPKNEKDKKKKNLMHIICHICKQPGHYANKCPQRKKKNDKEITLESGHLAKEGGEEFGKSCSEELCYFTSANDDLGNFTNWLLDSGATSHFTPCLDDLISPEILQPPIYIKVADGSRLTATHSGICEIKFRSDQGSMVNLRLLRVLYVPGLHTRLFSIESFISDNTYSAFYQNGLVVLGLGTGLSKTLSLPHVPPSTYHCHELPRNTIFLAQEMDSDDSSADDQSHNESSSNSDDSDGSHSLVSYEIPERHDPEDTDRDVLCLPCCDLLCCPSDTESSVEATAPISQTNLETSIDNLSLNQASISNNYEAPAEDPIAAEMIENDPDFAHYYYNEYAFDKDLFEPYDGKRVLNPELFESPDEQNDNRETNYSPNSNLASNSEEGNDTATDETAIPTSSFTLPPIEDSRETVDSDDNVGNDSANDNSNDESDPENNSSDPENNSSVEYSSDSNEEWYENWWEDPYAFDHDSNENDTSESISMAIESRRPKGHAHHFSYPISDFDDMPIEDLCLSFEECQAACDNSSESIFMANETNVDPIDGGSANDNWNPTRWTESQLAPKSKQRMNAELAHRIFGHRSILSLVKASDADLWDDVSVVMDHDSWCGDCSVASIRRNAMSRLPSRMIGLPLQHIFMDCIPCPGIMRGIKGYDAKDYLLLCDPISKFVDKVNLTDKSSTAVIDALQSWRGEMLRKGFELFIYLRSDAGTNFTSDEFKSWCNDNHIKLTIAGPRHQEQNGFVETSYKTLGTMARSMLVTARLPMTFMHLALDYATLILRVLPHRGLKSIEGKPITTYEVLHKKKPRIRRFRVFGCPVVFKRYKPQHEGDTSTTFRQLQRGSRGIFVGFPRNQAGWLIYVPEKIGGHHLVISMDVVFDQEFLSCPVGNDIPFSGAQPERHVGTVGGRRGEISEHTGDVTNITDTNISHWGDRTTFDSTNTLEVPAPQLNEDVVDDTADDGSTRDDATVEDEPMDNYTFHHDSDHDDDNPFDTVLDGGVRRSRRNRTATDRLTVSNTQGQTYGDGSINAVNEVKSEFIGATFIELEHVFETLNTASDVLDIPIAPYLPEPKSFRDIKVLPDKIRDDWLKAIKKEIKFLIENETFRKDEVPQTGDEIVPAIIVYKAKVTSRGYLDKLKARCVARGDLQVKSNDPDELWSPCVFARTFKVFVAYAVKMRRKIKQLDYIGAFCQGRMQKRLFIQLPKEYAELVPEYKEYFESPQLIQKSIYGTDIAAKVWNYDLTEWMINNDVMPFKQSSVDPSLYIHRTKDGGYVYMIVYVDDSLYFGSTPELEEIFEKALGSRFNVDLLGWSHWFLGTRLYCEEDGSYILDQENYIKHILNRYCGKETLWGLPQMQNTPAPVDYVFTKENRPKSEEEKAEIVKRFKGLSMASAVSSLLYAALNTRCDILWITNKLAKSSCCPGLKDFEALMHVFGYLRKYSDYAIKFYADVSQSPVHEICKSNNISLTPILGFSDASWQDCPDTGRSTCGYKIFIQGGLVDAQSTLPVPVALSSAESEYMGACSLGAMICHLRDLQYDIEYLGTDEFNEDGHSSDVPSILLIDNQATIRMSKNYKSTKKNRHIRRRWHFVRYGVQHKLFELKWVKAGDQLADDCTKTQTSDKSLVHFKRTLIPIPDKVKGFKSSTVGNR